MSHPVSNPPNRFHIGRWCWTAATVICLGLSGCANVDLRGEGFERNELSNFCRQVRPSDGSIEASAVTNKGLQIERDLGAR